MCPLLFFLLSALCVQHIHAAESTISTDGNIINHDDKLTERCVDFLSSKVSSCATYQIATLNASPRRCIHVEPLPPSSEEDVPDICTDYPNWHDGTNGCQSYAQHKHFCKEYGSLKYTATPYKAVEACCACGGGNNGGKPRLRIGDSVVVKLNPSMNGCKDLTIVAIETTPIFQYVVKVNKGCGMARRYFSGETLVEKFQYPEGTNIFVPTDDPSMIQKYQKIELRKCRQGVKAQEFVFQQGDKNATKIIIVHKETKSPLTTILGGATPFVNITQVWNDGLFDGSGDYFVSSLFFMMLLCHNKASEITHIPSLQCSLDFSTCKWQQIEIQVELSMAHRPNLRILGS